MRRLCSFRGALLFLAILQVCCTAIAQEISDEQVKAAYLYNFAKFVDWPAASFPSPTAPIRICVISDSSFQTQLQQTVRNKTISGRRLEVDRLRETDDAQGCHILFIPSVQSWQCHHLLQSVHDSSVLTVGESRDFVQKGGIINFVVEDDRVRFEVNHRGAREAGLGISARLLAIAKSVTE